MTDYINQITALIPQGVREKVLGNSGRELLAAVTDTLVVFGDDLLHLETGQSEKLVNAAETNNLEATSVAPIKVETGNVAAIATAAKRLLNSTDTPRTLLLFLAPSEFAATQQDMLGMTGTNLRSAITLQRESILPACDDTLALATANENPTGRVIALWTRADQLSDLFDAFAQYGLTLAAIAPRILALPENTKPENLLDDDGIHTTFVRSHRGVLEQWLQIKNDELEEPAYAEQWQTEMAQFESEAMQRADKLSSYTLTGSRSIEPAYTFFPAGSLAISRKAQRVRQFKLAAAVLSGILLVAASPFITQTLELQMATARLDSNRAMSVEAREDQAVVVDFENRWGPINDFPDQDVATAMFQLQEVLAGEQLSSLELSEGLIRIQGTSSDPQAILQRLEQDPMFTEVVFSRATSNTRYYIDLRLATVNFEAYMVRYFQDKT